MRPINPNQYPLKPFQIPVSNPLEPHLAMLLASPGYSVWSYQMRTRACLRKGGGCQMLISGQQIYWASTVLTWMAFNIDYCFSPDDLSRLSTSVHQLHWITITSSTVVSHPSQQRGHSSMFTYKECSVGHRLQSPIDKLKKTIGCQQPVATNKVDVFCKCYLTCMELSMRRAWWLDPVRHLVPWSLWGCGPYKVWTS